MDLTGLLGRFSQISWLSCLLSPWLFSPSLKTVVPIFKEAHRPNNCPLLAPTPFTWASALHLYTAYFYQLCSVPQLHFSLGGCLSLLRLLKPMTIDWYLNHRNLFLTVLEAKRQRLGCQHGQILLGTLFPACRWPPSFCVLTWQRAERKKSGSLCVSSYKDTKQFVRAPSIRPNYSQRLHLQPLSHWELGEGKGTQTFNL